MSTHIAHSKPSGAVYISQRAIKKSFCGAFFKKRQRKTALFFLRSFFFCASCVKRKSDRMRIDVAINQRRMYEKSNFSCHPERSEAESNFFRLRSQMSLRSICSSLRSEFDYAQDDIDEKSAERSKAGSTINQQQCSHPHFEFSI